MTAIETDAKAYAPDFNLVWGKARGALTGLTPNDVGLIMYALMTAARRDAGDRTREEAAILHDALRKLVNPDARIPAVEAVKADRLCQCDQCAP